ncbi:ParB/RepB/Spo0J family partition protein [Candidatus Mycobacterium methanotrophicum]|uniref:ParB/Srx family N-terminal domain-containing protein n=1 Tax=Candidatus Mycobacterium methanotrophicum TaxID=2943498 RepID=A0ABY4QR02_9MYCO|nr:ParB/Srx family N-terminal domain-containing protein [Candidatus Mycobacterium methanotrophicum]UQX13482.1 ParB/Srx family N-terminal domain-containing protein [Candidatus Mycobacterium methanotrophicum]
MNDPITQSDENTTTAEDAGNGTLEHINPAELVLDTNVRDEADIDANFVASIQEHGVLAPIVATRSQDGQVLVRAGQRRTLAAREAGLTSVPVYIRLAGDSDDKAQLVERVSE